MSLGRDYLFIQPITNEAVLGEFFFFVVLAIFQFGDTSATENKIK